MKIEDLSLVEVGDYGWCFYTPDDEPPRLVYYDDDEYMCSEGLDGRDPNHECQNVHCDEDERPIDLDGCFLADAAIIYDKPSDLGIADYDVVPFEQLRAFPASIAYSRESPQEGFVYIVSLIPEMNLERVKVGFTTDIDKRLGSFRTSSPTATLIGLWYADREDEKRARDALDGRVGRSEVFQVASAAEAVRRLDRLLGRGDMGLGEEEDVQNERTRALSRLLAESREEAPS